MTKNEWNEIGVNESSDIGVNTHKWEEIELDSEGFFDLEEFFIYWMDEVDPREEKRLQKEDYIMCGGGYY